MEILWILGTILAWTLLCIAFGAYMHAIIAKDAHDLASAAINRFNLYIQALEDKLAGR